MPETVFQESAAKVAIGFFPKVKIFESTAFGHMTEVPSRKYYLRENNFHDKCSQQIATKKIKNK